MEEEILTIEEDAIFSGVSSVNELTGDVTLKTINGQEVTGEGDIELTPATIGAQAALDQAQLDAVNSGIDSTKVAQIATTATQVETVNSKIPSTASSSNQLTDKSYVDNSIATNSANYISDNGQPFQSVAALEAYSGPLTNNDYAFVETIDQAGNDVYTRYKYNAGQAQWAAEYTITNPYFTDAQWASINSGVTTADVTKLGGIEAGAEVNDINSISINGTPVTPDTNKNVDLAIASPTVVQATGTSTTDVMSQNATSSMVFADPDTRNIVKIGALASTGGDNTIAIGWRAKSSGHRSVAIGWDADAGMTGAIAIGAKANSSNKWGAIALGAYSGYATTTGQRMEKGQMHIGTSETTYGYNDSNYRLLSGLYDPQTDHDAATKGYVDTHLGGLSFVALTQAEYDALATKDPNTLYVIKAA